MTEQSSDKSWLKEKLGQLKTFLLKEVIHVDDTPHRIGLGCAIGIFVAFTPTIPFQMVLTIFLSWIFRANKVVGLPAVWITNPATVIPIYLPQYALGCLILGIPVDNVDFSVLTADYGSTMAYANAAWDLMADIFWPLWVGSTIVSTIFGIVTYYVTIWAVRKYRYRKSRLTSDIA